MKNNLVVIMGFFIFIFINIFLYLDLKLSIVRILMLILFLITLVKSYKEGENNIILLFLISLFTFQYGRVILLPLLNNKPLEINWFVYYNISYETTKNMINILNYNIFGCLLGLHIRIRKIKIPKIKNKKTENLFLLDLLLLIGLIPFFYSNILQIKYIKKIGYATSYTKEIIGSKSIIIIILAAIFYTSLFLALALYEKRSKKQQIILILIYLISSLIISFKGARGAFIGQVFFGIWYVSNVVKYKINLKKYMIVFLCLIIFAQVAGSLRSQNKTKTTLFFKIEKFIEEQGITGMYLSQISDNPSLFTREYRSIPYIFYPFLGEKILSQDEKGLQKALESKRVNLDKKMSATLNSSIFLNGGGIGGNYILEMYDIGGKFGVLILSFISVYFYRKISFNFEKRNNALKILYLVLISRAFLIPRLYFFSFDLILLIKVFILYLFLLLINMILKGVRKNVNKSFSYNTSI